MRVKGKGKGSRVRVKGKSKGSRVRVTIKGQGCLPVQIDHVEGYTNNFSEQ